ncbi:MAG: DUF1801 domain-containing protein [Cytophagaceae bacterium]|jgi:hypothetical protein|nr:DUF1801 domain-containing protein [Cytophagaceae bacterium]
MEHHSNWERFEEPHRSCLIALSAFLQREPYQLELRTQYGMPFFLHKEKRICYLWYHQKLKKPYIGWVDGNLLDDMELLSENRSRMKILLLEPEQDLPINKIKKLLNKALAIAHPKKRL